MWKQFNAQQDYIHYEALDYVHIADISIVGIMPDGSIEDERYDDPDVEQLAWAVTLIHVIDNRTRDADGYMYIIDKDVTKYAATIPDAHPITGDIHRFMLTEAKEPFPALSENDRLLIADAIARFARRVYR